MDINKCLDFLVVGLFFLLSDVLRSTPTSSVRYFSEVTEVIQTGMLMFFERKCS